MKLSEKLQLVVTVEDFLELLLTVSAFEWFKDDIERVFDPFVAFLKELRLEEEYLADIKSRYLNAEEDLFERDGRCADDSDLVTCFITWANCDTDWKEVNEKWQKVRETIKK